MGPAGRRGKDGQKLRGKGGSKCTSLSAATNKTHAGKKGGREDKVSTGGRKDPVPSIGNHGQSLSLKILLIPTPLQQLVLNVFRSALLSSGEDASEEPSATFLPLSHRIQTLKAHLYSRDFVSAFADADEELLSAYALRWSAGRALAYAGIFSGVWEMLSRFEENGKAEGPGDSERVGKRVVCFGGGAGAEIVALAAVWRAMRDERKSLKISGGLCGRGNNSLDLLSLGSGISRISLRDSEDVGGPWYSEKTDNVSPLSPSLPDLHVTAVDIADWSSVIEKLSRAINSTSVPSVKECHSPLFPQIEDGFGCEFSVSFKKADVLGLADEELRSLLCPASVPSLLCTVSASPEIDGTAKREGVILVTLMFTLNELISTSISKTTTFLLRMTDLLQPGTVLLVVDSPGSYSSVALGGSGANSSPPTPSSTSPLVPGLDGPDRTMPPPAAPVRQPIPAARVQPALRRKYPMRFLLDHTLLSVVAGKWERIFSEESRWFRRGAERLTYEIGEGIRLEDMRFQVHVYRRLAC